MYFKSGESLPQNRKAFHMSSSLRFRHVAIAGAAFLALTAFRPAPLAALTIVPTAGTSDAQYLLAHSTGTKYRRHYTRKYKRNRYRYNNAPRYVAPYGYYQSPYGYGNRRYRNASPGIYLRF